MDPAREAANRLVAMENEYHRLLEEQFWASVQQELDEEDDDRYMGSDSDFSDHALGIDY